MLTLYQQLEYARKQMKNASKELRDRGKAKARAEADYQAVKNRRALEMKAEGHSGTMIQTLIKGDPEVNEKLFARDCAEVLYESAKEALQVFKLDAKLTEAQISREWNQNSPM